MAVATVIRAYFSRVQSSRQLYLRLPSEETQTQLVEPAISLGQSDSKFMFLTGVQFSVAKGRIVWDDGEQTSGCGGQADPVPILRLLSGVQRATQKRGEGQALSP